MTPFITHCIIMNAIEGRTKVHLIDDIKDIEMLNVTEMSNTRIDELQQIAVKGKKLKTGDIAIFESDVFLIEGV